MVQNILNEENYENLKQLWSCYQFRALISCLLLCSLINFPASPSLSFCIENRLLIKTFDAIVMKQNLRKFASIYAKLSIDFRITGNYPTWDTRTFIVVQKTRENIEKIVKADKNLFQIGRNISINERGKEGKRKKKTFSCFSPQKRKQSNEKCVKVLLPTTKTGDPTQANTTVSTIGSCLGPTIDDFNYEFLYFTTLGHLNGLRKIFSVPFCAYVSIQECLWTYRIYLP